MADNGASKELQRILSEDLDRVAKAKHFARVIRAAKHYRWVGLYDVDVQRELVSNIAWDGLGPPKYPVFPITKGLTARAIATKSTINVGDVAADPDYLIALSTTRSEIIVPILDNRGSIVVGTIDVESERPNAFDAVAEQLLQNYAELLRAFWT
jgi:L-methionine (R)-S-oxide reductase